ncbi:MAG: hypothetical protein WCY19_05285 [Candidatus Gastranaerophilaceae bacterium]
MKVGFSTALNYNSSNQNNKQISQPSFKSIHVGNWVPDVVANVLANSKNMKEIGKEYDIFAKYSFWSNTLKLNIKKLVNADPKIRRQKGGFSSLAESYTMLLTEKNSKDSLEDQLKALTPEKIEEFIKNEDL